MNKIFIVALLGLFLVSSVTAQSINFFYSPSCPHCNSVSPLVSELSKQFTNWQWNFLDVTQGSYNVKGVPTIRIKTSDCREIELVGSQEIPKFLKCEAQEMSTKECPTSTELNTETNSFFIR